MARTPYTNFHDLNLNWIIEKIKTVFTPDNPPPYPVTSVNQKTGAVDLNGTDIPVSATDPQNIANALASKYEKPEGGIPASDMAPGVIVDPTSIIDDTAGASVYNKTWSAHKLFQQEADILDLQIDKQDTPASAGTAGQVLGLNSELQPEWVNAVPDGSLTIQKFNDSLKHKTINNYVIPEEFGAVGDGVTDDTDALQRAINYAIANNIALQLTDGKTYLISEGLIIDNGWIEINKSTAIIKAKSTLSGAVISITSPNIITDRDEIGTRRKLSFNIDCTDVPEVSGSIGIYGSGMFEYIVHDTLIKGAKTGIEMASPGAEVYFENCYIDGTGIVNSIGVYNHTADIVYNKMYLFNCHTAFNITAFCDLCKCHAWMDRNISGSIGIKSSVTCRVYECYIDTYQNSIYKSNGSNLLMSDTYFFINNQFYTQSIGDAIIFYGENATDYDYSLLSGLFIVAGGNGSLTVKLSNINPFNVHLNNCRIETTIDKSMRTSNTGLRSRNDPLTSVESGITLSEQTSTINDYAISLSINILIGSSTINAWANIATTASGIRPSYTATLIGVREDTGESVVLFLNTNGKIATSRNLVAEKRYRIQGTYLR